MDKRVKGREDLAYFKDNPGYRRIFNGIYKKYRSLGRLGGTITLRNLTRDEKDVLGSHLRRDYSRKSSASFSVNAFIESLGYTRFNSYSLEEILEWYFDVDLISKVQEEALYLSARDKDFQTLLERHRDEPGEQWLENVLNDRGVGIRRLMVAHAHNRDELIRSMGWVCEALKILGVGEENRILRLPVLASRVTRDPHAFDRNTLAGDILIDALCTLYDSPSPTNNHEIADILYKGGILVDEISNFVTTSGLLAYKGGRPHPVWLSSMKEKEILQVPLSNLTDIDEITSPISKVFVVENPAVFSAILDGLMGCDIPPMVCSYGQLKLAGLVVLDKLAENGADIFYSGDFDPEGLLIADKLAIRYEEKFHLWRYGIEDYSSIVSDQRISSKRLAMLESIDNPDLQGVKKEMERLKLAGYQELLIENLLADVIDLMKTP